MESLLKPSLNFRRRAIRSILGLFSISTMLFVFQACYGTPQDFGQDVHLTGKITSKTDQSGIKGIHVSFKNLPQYTTTSEDGSFSMYCPVQDTYEVLIEDKDGDSNGTYLTTDTLMILDPDKTELFLQISMDQDQ